MTLLKRPIYKHCQSFNQNYCDSELKDLSTLLKILTSTCQQFTNTKGHNDIRNMATTYMPITTRRIVKRWWMRDLL